MAMKLPHTEGHANVLPSTEDCGQTRVAVVPTDPVTCLPLACAGCNGSVGAQVGGYISATAS